MAAGINLGHQCKDENQKHGALWDGVGREWWQKGKEFRALVSGSSNTYTSDSGRVARNPSGSGHWKRRGNRIVHLRKQSQFSFIEKYYTPGTIWNSVYVLTYLPYRRYWDRKIRKRKYFKNYIKYAERWRLRLNKIKM